MQVALEPLAWAARATLDNLFQLYVHDFSELWIGEPRAELGEDGLFERDSSLADYWTEPNEALLIRADGFIAGFALVNRHAHSGLPLDYSVAEFFVVRKHRRAGVGSAAAALLFAARPGFWEAAVTEKNVAAGRFWRAAIEGAGARDIEIVQGDGERWRGPIFRFRI
ncbi:MAG: GNAT family N-acetyltransferase [Alphaproteobacteria bacterium]|nr:GNAT family N-acetyltransferase [Alphaproteobacteria bacterium]